MSELGDDLLENAQQPKRLKAGDKEREAHSLREQIELDKHLSEQTAVGSNKLAVRFFKITPPGAS